MRIRDGLEKYQAEVESKTITEIIEVPIDKITLLDFVKNDDFVVELDKCIVKNLKCEFDDAGFDVDGDVERLGYFNVKTIGEVKSLLVKYKSKIESLAAIWGNDHSDSSDTEIDSRITGGISLFYLCHMLAGSLQNISLATKFYSKFSIGNPDKDRGDVARELTIFMATQA